jgi:hypothetical protein
VNSAALPKNSPSKCKRCSQYNPSTGWCELFHPFLRPCGLRGQHQIAIPISETICVVANRRRRRSSVSEKPRPNLFSEISISWMNHALGLRVSRSESDPQSFKLHIHSRPAVNIRVVCKAEKDFDCGSSDHLNLTLQMGSHSTTS